MLQESTTWNLRHMIREPSTSFKTYVLFLLVVCVVTSIKLIRVWRAAPPFRLSRQASNPSYPQLLQASSASSPWRNPFFLSDGSDNGDSGSFEMDEAAEAKNKGLCYRCTSGSA